MTGPQRARPSQTIGDQLPALALPLIGGGARDPDAVPPKLRVEMTAGRHPTALRLEPVAARIGLDKTSGGRDTAIFDYDGDGNLDVLIAAASDGGGLYHNKGDGTFRDVSREIGITESWGTMSGNAGDYLNVRLAGTASNRDAIGARVRLFAGGRVQHRLVRGGSGLGCLPLEQHFGVGALASIEAVEIDWPTRLRQRVERLPVNATVRITEGGDGFQLLKAL